jgi:hypothetical protein
MLAWSRDMQQRWAQVAEDEGASPHQPAYRSVRFRAAVFQLTQCHSMIHQFGGPSEEHMPYVGICNNLSSQVADIIRTTVEHSLGEQFDNVGCETVSDELWPNSSDMQDHAPALRCTVGLNGRRIGITQDASFPLQGSSDGAIGGYLHAQLDSIEGLGTFSVESVTPYLMTERLRSHAEGRVSLQTTGSRGRTIPVRINADSTPAAFREAILDRLMPSWCHESRGQ